MAVLAAVFSLLDVAGLDGLPCARQAASGADPKAPRVAV